MFSLAKYTSISFYEQVHESEQVHELLLKKTEAERIEKKKLDDAVAAAQVRIDRPKSLRRNKELNSSPQSEQTSKTSTLLTFLRLHSASTNLFNEQENYAILRINETLLGEESEQKQAVLSGFLSGQGDYETIPCALLLLFF